ncbi:CubicO group peptidase, beta-lactamase class C family [Muriicola jejuensis]|uniref:Serine hydrolase n=1 Tax=Muriicola jejuensis TaxID=504488 RepID=A0A6P0UBD2_9FLAO|nr:serine hydrolase [Muriicola jejuensis]NER09810.1 serine hydrolase [Muriicola jejuensis]SMP05586.1 CubicO group peptidase, beta-lactamase class C family [Muriicola jejuensis]
MSFRHISICFFILFGTFTFLYCQPSDIQDFDKLSFKIDSIITNGISNEAFPGAQLLVASKGEVVFHKTYGFHTYDSLQPVSKTDLYDLASVTKILGPLPLLMKLVEEGQLDLDEPFSKFWKPWRSNKEKKDLTLREILSHQAGLIPYIVFLKEVVKQGKPKRRFVRTSPNGRFGRQAYEGLWVKNNFEKKVFRRITRSKVDADKKYNYSGLAFLLFPALIENITGHSYPYLLAKEFTLPLETPSLGYLPSRKGFPNAVIPTEYDSLFRKDLVQGWVHDENASLFGGISGNAGLFGTTRDLFRFMQMYQNYGVLEGRRYLKEETLKEFTRVQYPENDNRRGLGFDKPLLDNASRDVSEAYPAPSSSPESFGHSGFTGTFVWADPKYQLVFIFLSNRVYPDRTHRNLYKLNIRVSLHQLFYDHLKP